MCGHVDDKVTVNNWKVVGVMLKCIIGSNWKVLEACQFYNKGLEVCCPKYFGKYGHAQGMRRTNIK